MKKILLISGLFVVAGIVFVASQNKSESPVTYALSDQEINKLETVRKSEVVELKDGDTYIIDEQL